ncbi:hypothetical protein [Xanthocytophaga agilis]|nr:hypothetical protein [Xanthocytophaga agilis]
MHKITIRDILRGHLGLLETIEFTATFFFVAIGGFIFSLPLLGICKIAQRYLTQHTSSEILIRIWIILIIGFGLLVLCYSLSREFLTSIRLTSMFLVSVVLASIYHSFRDKLNNYA